MKRYGLLLYDSMVFHQHVFDVISIPWNFVEIWPTAPPIEITDKDGQVQYQWPKTVFFKIVEDLNWGVDQDAAINGSVTEWNANHGDDRQVPATLQLVYTEEEAKGIYQIFEDERQRLIDQL